MSDNLRWDALELREGDIVISAPGKCGTTWTQRLVSLLVFDGPDLPGPLSTISPWLDQNMRPIGQIVAALDAQDHRRFIKTHTPLDGLILDERVTYLGVGRDPRDAAVSAVFQEENVMPQHQPPPYHAGAPQHPPRLDPRRALSHWMELPVMPPEGLGSLATILQHLSSIWDRRHLPNVALFHYTDLMLDLAGELVRLAGVLGIDVTPRRAAELAGYATLDAMRGRASDFVPNAGDGIWRSDARFFRSGRLGEWQQIFSESDYRRYVHRADQLAAADVLRWAHHGRRAA